MHGFDAWWNGGLRSVPAFHNMHGILTETAGYGYATPHDYKKSDMPERFANGTAHARADRLLPAPVAGRQVAAARRRGLHADGGLRHSRSRLAPARALSCSRRDDMARAAIEPGGRARPTPTSCPPSSGTLRARSRCCGGLHAAGIEVRRAKAQFTAGGKTYPAGTCVLPAAQPFRGYLVDLMEPQKYPEMRSGRQRRRPSGRTTSPAGR